MIDICGTVHWFSNDGLFIARINTNSILINIDLNFTGCTAVSDLFNLQPITTPRAEIVDTHEACSCFPDRSDKLRGSMLYDKITCIHTGLVGHTQAGVFKVSIFIN